MPRSTALLVLPFVAVLAAPSAVRAGGPDLGPSEDDIEQARKLAAAFRRADGIERAMWALCRDARSGAGSVRHDAAFTVLVERAAAAMPKLLDAVAAGQAPNAAEHDQVWRCYEDARGVARTAACSGHHRDAYFLDHRTEEEIEQSRGAAQRALVAALGKSGARRRAAIDVMRLPPEPGNDCDDDGLLGLATPALVKMLAMKDQETEVLQLFAGGGDPRIAAPAIRPYLADRKRMARAALALAHMDEDMSSAVPQLAGLLDGADVEVALEALGAIGAGARGALPNLVALSKRLNATCTAPVRAERLVAAAGAIAKRPEDGPVALQALAPLLSRCPETLIPTAEAIAMLGDGGRVLLTYLRDDERTISSRLQVANVMQELHARFNSADQTLVRMLEARDSLHNRAQPAAQVPEPTHAHDPLTMVREEANACRAEGGLAPVAVAGISAKQAVDVALCLRHYLCGPSRRSLARTLDRCCGPVFGAQRPAFCSP
jgi:hypothetical protein